MIEDTHIAWMGVGIAIGGIISIIVMALNKWAQAHIEKDNDNDESN